MSSQSNQLRKMGEILALLAFLRCRFGIEGPKQIKFSPGKLRCNAFQLPNPVNLLV